MKIIHCADLHLDSPMRAHLDPVKSKERKMELLETFRNMVHYAVQEEVGAILIAGDLFDSKHVSKMVMNAFLRQIETHPEIAFYYLRGNHDALSLPESEGLPKNLHLFSDTWKKYPLNKDENVMLYGVEYNGRNEHRIYEALSMNADDFNIVMLHGQTADHNMGDRTEYIEIPKLQNIGLDYLALGHVHSYALEKIDARASYCFPGCLEGRGFDECGEHGFVLLDIDEESGKYTSEFVPFAFRRLYRVEVDVTGMMSSEEMRDLIEQTLDNCRIDAGSLIKIVLRGDVDVSCEKNIDYLLHAFENRFYFVTITDETKMQVDFRMYAFDESLKGEFIRNVLASELTDTEKGEVIHFGLMALKGEEIAE
ncbi:MAG: DNA repair exonuclease [Lachnospiraceae bacterium]|nr:DNA repair exonuclease [Lachnospiraceae bacterium]MCR4684302.1 DNA repair exonuclease [Lachnospiraceae bacterium]